MDVRGRGPVQLTTSFLPLRKDDQRALSPPPRGFFPLLFLLLALAGCVPCNGVTRAEERALAAQWRRQDYLARNPGCRFAAEIRRGALADGMTAAEVEASRGGPVRSWSRVGRAAVAKVVNYDPEDARRWLFFDGNVLVGWEE